MLSRIKYRLLGIIVLVGLLLIILPMLFDNIVRYQTVARVNPPPMPVVTVAAQPKQPVITPVPANKNLILQAYTVQVASFKETATVDHLVALLQKDGFTAYSRQLGVSGFTAVFVGPVLTKTQANLVLAQLVKKYKVKPFITSYTPQEA